MGVSIFKVFILLKLLVAGFWLLALPSEALAKEGCWLLAQGSGLRAQGSTRGAQEFCQLHPANWLSFALHIN
jgi:hypothetical protein